tara:strand:+ start:5547 stop:6683 length:1137 start_codon:yes stop_codon:yes gene_type:complete
MDWRLMQNAITDSDRKTLCDFIMSTDMYTNGKKVKEFEEAWSDWLGAKYSLMVTSGSTANFLLLASIKELYGIPDGSKVLVPSCTWVTNVAPVFQLGMEPVFCDVNLTNFSFDMDNLPNEDIKIIFVTYLLGFGVDIETLKKRYPNALLIEDICESHGVKGPDGVRRGADSLGATFSFYFGHHMTTIEGGIVSTNNKKLYDLMKLKRSHGMARNLDPDEFEKVCLEYPDLDPQFLFVTDGYNFRSTELNAVLGLEQLKRLNNTIDIRNDNYKGFVNIIHKYPDKFEQVYYDKNDSNYAFPIICKTPDLLKKLKILLKENDIEYRPIVSGNLLKHPFLAKWKKPMPNADILNDRGLYIGNNQFVNTVNIKKLDALVESI